LHYDAADCLVFEELSIIIKTFSPRHIVSLSNRLREISNNFYLTIEQFEDLLDCKKNPFLKEYLHLVWCFMKTKEDSRRINGLEFLAGVALCSESVYTIEDKMGCFFDIFDLDNTGLLGSDELQVMVKMTLTAMSKFTHGLHDVVTGLLGPNPSTRIREFAQTCMVLTEKDMNYKQNVVKTAKGEIGITKQSLVKWVKKTTSVHYLLRHFLMNDTLCPATFRKMHPRQRMAQAAAREAQTYHKAMANVMQEQREKSAIERIQAVFRGKKAKRMTRQKAEGIRKRKETDEEAGATLIQRCFRNQRIRRLIEQRAIIEMQASNGAVYTFGSGVALGQPEKHLPLYKPRVLDHFKMEQVKIRSMSSSPMHALAISEDGTPYVWGNHPTSEVAANVNKDVFINATNHSHDAYAVAAYSTPSVMEPLLSNIIQNLDKNITATACGNRHCVVLSEDGAIYSWGCGDQGQLGHGDEEALLAQTGEKYRELYDRHANRYHSYLDQPVRLAYFAGSVASRVPPLHIVEVCCGHYYTTCLTKQGAVYTWGEGSEGQLGHGFLEDFEVGYMDEYIQRTSYTYLNSPRRVDGLAGHVITHVGCGGNHSMCVAKDYRVYEWGSWGRRVEMEEDGDARKEFSPVEMVGAPALRISQLAVGAEHTVAIGGSLWLELDGQDMELYTIKAAYGPGMEELAAMDSSAIMLVDIKEEDRDREESDLTEEQVADLDKQDSLAAARRRALQRQREAALHEEDAMEGEERNSGSGSGSGSGERGPGGEGLMVKRTNMSDFDDPDNAEEDTLDTKWEKRSRHAHADQADFMSAGHLSVAMVELQMRGVTEPTYQELLETYFSRSKGKLVVLKRGNEPGTYLRIMTGKQTGNECKAVAAKYGPALTKLGVSARLYTPPPGEEQNMMYLVGKRQMPGSVALLEFTENDVQMDVDEMDPENMVEILMKALNKRVYDAQQAGAVAVVIIFDYHGAEPFVLEAPEGEDRIFIPALMVKRHDGDMLRQCMYEKGPLEDDIMLCAFQRVDSLSEQIAIAQRLGAAGVVVQQHEDVLGIEGTPPGFPTEIDDPDFTALVKNLNSYNTGGSSSRSGSQNRITMAVTMAVSMVSYQDGERVCAMVREARREKRSLSANFKMQTGGNVYAWGYGEDGRLGLGDVEESDVFEIGYDPNTDLTYAYVVEPTMVGPLLGKHVTSVSAGFEHSAAVTEDGAVFTWGSGEDGKLGHGDTEDRQFPTKVDQLRFVEVATVHASESHTVALCTCLDDEEMEYRRLAFLANKKAAKKTVIPYKQ